MKVQTEQVALLLAHRSDKTERALIARMVANHELVQRSTSPNPDAIQLDLLGGEL